mmetsp:Transcript_60358/g.69961  ORF Transcript_60358/g.69961 Transcript_60358/m.69961 type:complete len:205 (+) Transcript_60358:105-719(+)
MWRQFSLYFPPFRSSSSYALLLPSRSLKYSPYDSLRRRPQSPAAKKRDEMLTFPKTLKSGRSENKSTVAQKLFSERTTNSSSQEVPDRRFFRPLEDYREIQDGDPYAKLFGESKLTAATRVRQWQKQFEEENANVELPYERDTMLKRAAPNWFVRYFVDLRDSGGLNHGWHLAGLGVLLAVVLVTIAYLLYTTPSKARPLSELR